MPECVVPRNEGEPNLTEQVHQKHQTPNPNSTFQLKNLLGF